MGKARVSESCGQFPACRRGSPRLCSKISIPPMASSHPRTDPGFQWWLSVRFHFCNLMPKESSVIFPLISLLLLHCQQKRFSRWANTQFCGLMRPSLGRNSGREHLAGMRCMRLLQLNQHLVVCQALTLEPHLGPGGTQRSLRNSI